MKKIISFLILFGLLLGFLFHPTLVFIVEDINNSKILYRKEVEPGLEFATLIRHSVQRTPVYEYYKVKKDGSLIVVRTALQDLGWGMPSNLEHKVKFENDFMIMEGINRRVNILPFRISFIAEPHLIINQDKIDLRNYSEDSHLINVYAYRKPFIAVKLRREINVFQERAQAGIIP